ncbi:Uncharacterised protein [Mycobacteroides abscessus subsp. abscessus]|nr:Uncharacterised protein [Mycobacteroides abscessus subsp. abscessus]SLD35042.1 Uncharacterised protein [Mycobacteroides abscessus subsp. massiliense]
MAAPVDGDPLAVQLGQLGKKALCLVLVAPQSRHYHGVATGGVGCFAGGVGEQRVWRNFDEGSVTVQEGGGDRVSEPHRLAKVVAPVLGIERRSGAGVIEYGAVHENPCWYGTYLGKCCPEVCQDRIHLGAMGCVVDRNLAGVQVAGFPACDQLLDPFG